MDKLWSKCEENVSINPMNRRQFNRIALIGGAALLSGTAAWIHIPSGPTPKLSDWIDQLQIGNPEHWRAEGKWSVSEILQHLVQSIEYSMTGYPEHKSDTFKTLIGKPAFYVFQQKSQMKHSLDEVIPSAPELNATVTVDEAANRLTRSIETFLVFQGTLAPHFAYGTLSKSEYELAHALHIQNHWQEITRPV